MSNSLELAMAEVKERAIKVRKRPVKKTFPLLSPEAIAAIREESAADEPCFDDDKEAIEQDVAPIKPNKKEKKSVKKAKTPKTAKKTKPAKKAKAPKKKKTGTPAQLKAAKKRHPRIDWVKEIGKFRASKSNNMRMEMGSAGSAQVTRVRLLEWEGAKGLVAFTRGANLFVSKLKMADAIAAAKKAGKA